jgi:hypothetical protein
MDAGRPIAAAATQAAHPSPKVHQQVTAAQPASKDAHQKVHNALHAMHVTSEYVLEKCPLSSPPSWRTKIGETDAGILIL